METTEHNETGASAPQTIVMVQPKSTALAYVLLIFLGQLGIHRFYVNRPQTAIAQLILGLVGWATAIFVVGLIPLAVLWVWLIVDLFLTYGMVEQANQTMANPELNTSRPTRRTSPAAPVDPLTKRHLFLGAVVGVGFFISSAMIAGMVQAAVGGPGVVSGIVGLLAAGVLAFLVIKRWWTPRYTTIDTGTTDED